MEFFLAADAELCDGNMKGWLSRPDGLPESALDMMASLHSDREDCAQIIAEDESGADLIIYRIECASDIMDAEEANEALSLALFEGGSLNPDLRIIHFAKA